MSEMLKRLPLVKVYEVAKFFQERFIGRAEAQVGLLEKTRCGAKESDQEFQDHCAHGSYVEMVCNVRYLASGGREGAGGVGASASGWSRQDQLSIFSSFDDPFITHWEWRQERREGGPKHGFPRHPTMYVASMDVKTASDVAKPKRTANFWKSTTCMVGSLRLYFARWMVLRERPILRMWRACSRSHNVSRRAEWKPKTMAKHSQTETLECRAKLESNKIGIHIQNELEDNNQVCSFMWADNYWIMSHKKENVERMMKELVEEVERWDMEPEPASLWRKSTYAQEEKQDMVI